MLVKELTGQDQRTEGPGIYLLDGHTFGVKPQCHGNSECIPFSWATEFPPVGDFVMRFPGYWKALAPQDVWIGGDYNPAGIYWGKYDPQQLRKAP